MNANTNAVATLTSGTQIVARSGKVVGQRFHLGMGPIAEMKKALRDSGMSARDASATIAEKLKGAQGSIAWAQAATAMELARSKGMYPTGFDLRNKSFTIRGSAAPTFKASEEQKRADALKALGITEDDLALLKTAK